MKIRRRLAWVSQNVTSQVIISRQRVCAGGSNGGAVTQASLNVTSQVMISIEHVLGQPVISNASSYEPESAALSLNLLLSAGLEVFQRQDER